MCLGLTLDSGHAERWKEELHRRRGPIWVVFTADGKYAYAEKGYEDTCTKVDGVMTIR